MPEKIIDRIEARLKELNVSAAKASVDAGLSIDAIRNIRRKGGIPRGDTINKLANYLKVTREWLLTGKEVEEQTIIDAISNNPKSIPGFVPEITDDKTIVDSWHFPNRFLNDELQVLQNSITVFRVRGDSMSSTSGESLNNGDRVLINRDDTAYRQGGIFAIQHQNEIIIKQVEPLPNNDGNQRIRCTSLNSRYAPFELNLSKDAEIIGRIVCKIARI